MGTQDFHQLFESLERVHSARLREWKDQQAKLTWRDELIRWKKIFFEIVRHFYFYLKIFPLVLAIGRKYYWDSNNITKDIWYGNESHQKLDIYAPQKRYRVIMK
jgi:hypothetical protein